MIEALHQAIREASPALAESLSELGRQAAFPPDIPFQAAQARGKRYNATIGQITDGAGSALALPSLASALATLEPPDANRALLYSPVEGIPELRRLWRDWQRRDGQERPSTLPAVTVGLTHGLSLAADLFADPGRPVAVAGPFWGNYRQVFALRRGARMVSAPAFRSGDFQCEVFAEALEEVPSSEPAVAILNFPSNPGGYTPTREERRRLVASLVDVARRRPLIAVCDDAYAGLVYEDEVPAESIFWDLIGAHESLVPVKVDGGTKEFSFFGGRVGFLTFPFEPESAVAEALESKTKCLVRAAVGSPVATSQVILLRALRGSDMAREVEEVRRTLAGRYRTLRAALGRVDPSLLVVQPFNSGCFALVEVPQPRGVGAEAVRRHLLDDLDTGVVAIGERHVRIAFCSVAAEDLPEVVTRLEAGVAELSRQGAR